MNEARVVVGSHDAGRHDAPIGHAAVSVRRFTHDTQWRSILMVVSTLAVVGVFRDLLALQRAGGLFLGIVVRSTPFVLLGALFAGCQTRRTIMRRPILDAFVCPCRPPWLGFETSAQAGIGQRRAVLSRAVFAMVLAPAVIVAGLVLEDFWTVWLVAVSTAAVTAGLVTTAAASGSEQGRAGHDVRLSGVATASFVGVPLTRHQERISRCAVLVSVGLRTLVVGAAIVALVAGLPPDAWVQWLQRAPVVAVAAGLAVGLCFPPVPEAVPAGMLALGPFGVGTQLAFGVAALTANLWFLGTLRDWCGHRTAYRYGAVVLACAVTVGLWGAVVG